MNGYRTDEWWRFGRRRVATLLVALGVSLVALTAQLLRPGVALGSNVVNETYEYPLAIELNTCTDPVEPVALHGRLHIVMTSTVDKQGGYHVGVHSNTQSVKGTGLITGQKYTSSSENEDVFHAGTPFPVVQTVTHDFVLISRGGAANTVLKTTFHITVNADGDPTAAVDDVKSGCNG